MANRRRQRAAGEAVDTSELLQRLHDSEINASISSFFDGVFQWQLGDDLNGWQHEGRERTARDAILALATKAAAHFPKSDFAVWWKQQRKTLAAAK